jgi:hypothetical protein
MYGNTTNSEGKSLDNAIVPVITGLHVAECKVDKLEIATDQEGNEDTRRAFLFINQPNGAVFRHSIWDGKKNGEPDEGAMDRLNGFMLHLALGSKFVSSEDEYKTLIGNPSSFKEFIRNFNNNIITPNKAKSLTFTISKKLGTDGKWRNEIPVFPPFVEPDGTNPTTFYVRKGKNKLIFEVPETTSAPTTSSDNGSDDDVF